MKVEKERTQENKEERKKEKERNLLYPRVESN